MLQFDFIIFSFTNLSIVIIERFLNMNANKNFIKTKYTFNEFLQDFSKIYPSNYANKYLEILKSYSDIQNKHTALQSYNKIQETHFTKFQSLHPSLHLSLFQLYFGSLFPKPNSPSMTNLHQLIQEYHPTPLKKKNSKIRSPLMMISNENEDSNQINFNKMISFQHQLKIIHHNSNVIIQFIDPKNTNSKIEYTWGSEDIWNTLFPRLQIKEEDLPKLLHNKNILPNTSDFYEERKLNELMQNLEMVLQYIKNHSPSTPKLSLQSPHNQSLQKLIQSLLSKNNPSISDTFFQNIQNTYTIFKYIQKNIYPFIIFDTNVGYKISVLARKLFYHFFQQPQFEKIFPNTNKALISLKILPWINSFQKEDVIFILMIINLFSILYELYEISTLSYQDIILSFLLHQYSPYLLENLDMKYRIRYMIPIFNRNKYAFIQYLKNYPNQKKVELLINLIMPNGLFVDFIYEAEFPFDPLLRERSLIVPEPFYSEVHSILFYLIQISMIDNLKKLSIMNPILYKIFRKVLNKNKLPTFIRTISLTPKELISSSDLKSQIEYIHSNKINKWKFQQKAKLMVLPQNKQKKISQKGGDYGFFHEVPSDIKDKFNIIELTNLNPHFKKPTEYAYVSLLYGNNPYFLETMTFGFSLYTTGTPYDRVLFITEDVPQVQREQLARFFNRIFLVQSLNVDPKYFFTKNRWYGVFDKLYAYYLDEYKKIIVLDTDMIILKNLQQPFCPLDTLFQTIHGKFAGMSYHPDYILTNNEKIPIELVKDFQDKQMGVISGGVLLIQPSKVTFYDMIRKLDPTLSSNIHKISYKFPEEGFLSHFFENDITTISVTYNFCPFWITSKEPFSHKIENIQNNQIHVLHFGGYKMYEWILNPIWSLFDSIHSTNHKSLLLFKQLWIIIFMQMEELCSKPSYGTVYAPIIFIRDFCNSSVIDYKT